MANEAPRGRATAPSFPGTTKGETKRVSSYAFTLFPPFLSCALRPVEESAKERDATAAAIRAIANGHIPLPYDGDNEFEQRLATLLWRWTN